MSILDDILPAHTTTPVGGDALAEHLWVQLHCDPADPHPELAWAHVPAVTREYFGRIADEARAYFATSSATAPRARLLRWESAFDVPIGATFRPLHDAREYVRIDDNARALPPTIDSVKIPLAALDERHSQGFVEVPNPNSIARQPE